jgi:mono/diheme cytochrome c family protein
MIVAAVAVLLAGFGIAYSGSFDVSAQERHWPAIERRIAWARDGSISAHAKEVTVPASFDGRDQVVRGMVHYREHCAVCHGGPGVEADDMAKGMYPAPPDLRQAAARRTPAELFWIVRNGIAAPGMPSGSPGMDGPKESNTVYTFTGARHSVPGTY